MRFIKMSPSDKDTCNYEEMNRYFDDTLLKRNPAGRFQFKKGKIKEGTLLPGETLVFVFNTKIIRISRSVGGLFRNDNMTDLPFYIVVDMDVIQGYDVPVGVVRGVFEELGYTKDINGQGWNRVSLKGVPFEDEFTFMQSVLSSNSM